MYLYVKPHGRIEGFQDIQESHIKIFHAAFKHSLSKVLIDARDVEGELSATDRCKFGEFLSRELRREPAARKVAALRLAYIVVQPVLDPRRFVETVARNRGVPIKTTESIDEALEWLGENEVNNNLA
ncbi:MAG: hypothetical protein JSV77_00055 [Dehalococcoidales bacterium]|nr:MAG: hypothetical protein JSV77_00055 [Dehalococcoidales bacterium]